MVSRHSLASKVAVALALFAVACGAEHPLQRGEPTVKTQPQVDPGGGSDGEDTVTPKSVFLAKVRPNVEVSCKMCHDGSFISDDAEADYAAIKALISAGSAADSLLFKKAQGGEGHGGGELWSAGSAELEALKGWIDSES